MAKKTKKTKAAKPESNVSWSEQARFNGTRGVSLNARVDASVVMGVISKIQERRNGVARPEDYVEESRSTRSPTHKTLEWDDTVAGERYRLEQARMAMRCIVVHYASDDSEPRQVRALSSVVRDDVTGYARTLDAMQDEVDKEYILDHALSGLKAWRKRWAELNEVPEARAAMRKIDAGISDMRSAIASMQ